MDHPMSPRPPGFIPLDPQHPRFQGATGIFEEAATCDAEKKVT